VSFQGTLGPFVKGSATKLAVRLRVLIAFAAAFVAGALVTFGAAHLIGVALGVASRPLTWRLTVAAIVFGALALIDVFTIRKRDYCPLGIRRQTPRHLARPLGLAATAAFWGFDTGLAVTTYRVATITWAALVMTAFGLAPWWIGAGYGIGFAAPMLFVLVTRDPDSGTLHGLMTKRPLLQFGSAVALFVAGGVLLIRG
jgi:hypothetical protein